VLGEEDERDRVVGEMAEMDGPGATTVVRTTELPEPTWPGRTIAALLPLFARG